MPGLRRAPLLAGHAATSRAAAEERRRGVHCRAQGSSGCFTSILNGGNDQTETVVLLSCSVRLVWRTQSSFPSRNRLVSTGRESRVPPPRGSPDHKGQR